MEEVETMEDAMAWQASGPLVETCALEGAPQVREGNQPKGTDVLRNDVQHENVVNSQLAST